MVQVQCSSSSLITFVKNSNDNNFANENISTPTFNFYCVENKIQPVVDRSNRKRSSNSETLLQDEEEAGPSSVKKVCFSYYYKLAQETPERVQTSFNNDEEDASYDSLNERETGKFLFSKLLFFKYHQRAN